MSYEKPELALIGSAVQAVMGDKDHTVNVDGFPGISVAAYQGDE
jgi:hypothetical protein